MKEGFWNRKTQTNPSLIWGCPVFIHKIEYYSLSLVHEDIATSVQAGILTSLTFNGLPIQKKLKTVAYVVGAVSLLKTKRVTAAGLSPNLTEFPIKLVKHLYFLGVNQDLSGLSIFFLKKLNR